MHDSKYQRLPSCDDLYLKHVEKGLGEKDA